MTKREDLIHPMTSGAGEGVRRRQQEGHTQPRTERARFVVAADRLIFWISRRWLALFNTMTFVYVALPFVAPTLMHVGARSAAFLIYAIYSPLCHQLPQRSWFLFGPKMAYRLPELMALAGDQVTDAFSSSFIGSEALGYKVAFCQRDAAIYGAILVFGLLYGVLRRHWDIRPLPWWAYILLGLMPMGLDGGYQFLSYLLPLIFPSISLQAYETTPAMRVVTGVLFGWATVWLAYPHMQAAMEDVQASLEQRFAGT